MRKRKVEGKFAPFSSFSVTPRVRFGKILVLISLVMRWTFPLSSYSSVTLRVLLGQILVLVLLVMGWTFPLSSYSSDTPRVRFGKVPPPLPPPPFLNTKRINWVCIYLFIVLCIVSIIDVYAVAKQTQITKQNKTLQRNHSPVACGGSTYVLNPIMS